MEYIGFDQLSYEEWDAAVCNSDDGWAFSIAEWLAMVTPIWYMENLSFAIRENGKIVAVMPLHWIPFEKRLSSSGWGHGGPAIIAEVSAQDRRRLWRVTWTHVEEIATQFMAQRITVSLSPICKSSLTNIWGVNPLVEVGFSDISTHTRLIDLRQTDEGLWYGLAKDARQKIKLAQSLGYNVRRCAWRDFLEDYYRVHTETCYRTGIHPYPKAYFEGIAAQPEEYYSLWVGFDIAGKPVAFHNDARFKSVAMYHTGCSETIHLKSGINYLLFWEAICGERAEGLLWYESGEVFPAAKSGKEKGLTDFKSKFGGELHRVFRGEKFIDRLPAVSLSEEKTINQLAESRDWHSILHNWLSASRDLSSVILGRKFTDLIKKFLFGAIKQFGRNNED